MAASKEKAIQWSIFSIMSLKLNPISRPINGIIAWKRPKNNPTFRASEIFGFFYVAPSAIDTVEQSIARLKDMSNIFNINF